MVRVGWMSLIFLLITAGVRGETVRLNDLVFDLPSAAGLCTIDRNHPIGRKFYEQQARAQSGRNRLLSLAIDCRDVETLAQNPARLRRWASWTITAPNGVPARLPEGHPRAEVLSAVAQMAPAIDKSQIDSIIREASKREGPERSLKVYGVVDRDRYATYMGDIGDYVGLGRQIRVIGIIGVTPIGQSLVSFNLFHAYDEGMRFDGLLVESKRVMKLAVERNEAIAAK